MRNADDNTHKEPFFLWGKAFFMKSNDSEMVAEQTTMAPRTRLDSVARQIGHTPLVALNLPGLPGTVSLLAKQEWMQLSGSIKARAAYQIVSAAWQAGQLPEARLLDRHGGNMSLAYAALGAVLDFPVTICLPENATEKRKVMLQSYGAELVYLPPGEALENAMEELIKSQPRRFFYPDADRNPHNWQGYTALADEIYAQTEGRITHFVTGVGTGGTFTGVGRRLRALKPDVRLIALQPDAPLHGLEGWQNFTEDNYPPLYDPALADQVLAIDTYEAFDMMKTVARTEGMLISPSAAANLVGAQRLSQQMPSGVVVTVLTDSADKYGEVLENMF